MHIVLVSFEFPPLNAVGGIGSYMYHLCRILNDANNRVTVFSANPNAEILKVEEYEYCTNYLLPSKTNEAFRKDVLPVFNTFLEKNKVDVIESPEVGACALLIKENNLHIPLVVKMHTPGVLITKVNNTKVNSIEALKQAIKSAGNTAVISGVYASQPQTEYQYALNDLNSFE